MVRQLTRSEIEETARRIAPHVRATPLLRLRSVAWADYDLSLKLEHTQVTGSFKPRGAFSLLTDVDVPAAGIVAASGGNFGIAAAYAASVLGHRAAVFVPKTSPSEKIDRIGSHGAEVHVIDGYYDEALEASRRYQAETGAFEAHAYDQAEVMAGQGTVGIELDDRGFTDVLVAVGGGGLIGGIASWFRGGTRVVAVEAEQCRSFHASLEAGQRVEVEVGGVASSSLGARSVGEYPWAAREWIHDSVVVSDEAIVAARRWLWAETRLAVEPAAATTLAALQTGAYLPPPGSQVVVVLSGGNADPTTI